MQTRGVNTTSTLRYVPVLDTYWAYLTHGAVDITSVIRPHAPDLRARAQRLGGDPPDTEGVTLRGSAVTLVGSGDEEGHDASRPDPPRAGRSRSPRPSVYIPVGTQSFLLDNQPCCCEPDRLCDRHTIPVGTRSVSQVVSPSSLYEVPPQHQEWCAGVEAGARVAVMAWSPAVPSAPAPGRLGSGARAVPLSSEAGIALPVCPCCGGTAGLLRAGEAVCTLCQRAPMHGCGRCWDHCACTPHPMTLATFHVEQGGR